MTIKQVTCAAVLSIAAGCSMVERQPVSTGTTPAAQQPEDDSELAAQVVQASIIVSIQGFFALLDPNSATEPLSESHIAQFLHVRYELLAAEQLLLLGNIDLELRFETVERLGTPTTLAECKALCDRGNQTACALFSGVLARYSATEVESALSWVADREAATRAVAHSIFGQVEDFAVGPIHVDASSAIHAHVFVQSVKEGARGSREWLFLMQYDHDHWHIANVEPAQEHVAGGAGEVRSTALEL